MGHRPFRELTKHFTPERRANIEAGKAKIREEVELEKAKRRAGERRSIVMAKAYSGGRQH